MSTETLDPATGAPVPAPAGVSADDWLPPRHPLLAAIDTMDRALDRAAGCDPAYLGLDDRREALLALAQLEGRLEAVRLAVMATAEDLAHRDGFGSVGAWQAHYNRADLRPSAAEVRLAKALDRRWQQVATGLASGAVNPAQARVIVAALEDLPEDDVPADVLQQAEARLVAEAARFAPRQLRVLGRRILEVVAPEVYEAQEAKALQREEQRAHRATALFTHSMGDGTTRISLRVPDAAATRLLTYLHAFTSPRRSGGAAGDLGEKVPAYRRLGHAFCAFLEAADPKRMPLHGGDATTLLITVSLDDLRKGLGAAGLGGAGTDERLSAGEVRRLACTATLIPVVLGGPSEPLDLGRAARLYNSPQRKAMAIRDKRCRAEGCQVPAAWCEAHHFGQPWAQGGRTDLADGRLLCSWHHHRAHDPGYRHIELANGDIRFHRRR